MASSTHGGGIPGTGPPQPVGKLALPIWRFGAMVVAMLRGTMPVETTEFQALKMAEGELPEANPGLYIAYALGPSGCLVCAEVQYARVKE